MIDKKDPEIDVFTSALKYMWVQVLLIAIYAVFVYGLFKIYALEFTLPFIALSTVGTALAMLTAFRFRLSYDKWVGALLSLKGVENKTRQMARILADEVQTPKYQEDSKENFEDSIALLRGFSYALHYTLSHRKNISELCYMNEKDQLHIKSLVPPKYWDDIHKSSHPPLRMLRQVSSIHPQREVISIFVSQLEDLIATFETIKSTPVPKRYRYLFNFLNYFFTMGLPWCLIHTIGVWGVFFTVLNFFLFSILEEIGRRTEIPFGNRRQDIRTIDFCERSSAYLKSFI